MKSVSLLAGVVTLIDPAGNRDFINIQNNNSDDVWVCYDGADQTLLTQNSGWKIPANGGTLFLSNDGNRNVYNKAVYGFSLVDNGVIVQGA